LADLSQGVTGSNGPPGGRSKQIADSARLVIVL